LRVHPRELYARFAGQEKSVVVHADAVPGSAFVPGDYVRQDRVQFGADEVIIPGMRGKSVDGLEKPECRVDRVVLGRLAGVRETVGQHSAIYGGGEGGQNAASHARSSGG